MEPRDLSAHTEYRPGRGIEAVARDLGLDPAECLRLSSNENPLGPSPEATRAIREHAATAHAYPKAAHADLTAALAQRWDVSPAQIWPANGSDGAIDYLSRAMLEPGDRVLVGQPGFAYYAMSARFHHGEVSEFEISGDDGFALVAQTVLSTYDGERIVYLTSPHNPTGGEYSLDDVSKIADETAEDSLVVVDEAYGEFSDRESAVALLADHDDIAVLRTFSKAYGLAGLRLGYAVVPDAWADAYARVNTPFAASELACRAGLAALGDDEHLRESVSIAEWGRENIRADVEARTWPSAGNFVLVDVGEATAVAEALENRGVLVRDCTSFGLPDCIRVTCGTNEGTRRAVEAINEVLADR